MQQRDEEVADCEKLARAARGRLEQPRLVPASDLGHLDRCCHQRAGAAPTGPTCSTTEDFFELTRTLMAAAALESKEIWGDEADELDDEPERLQTLLLDGVDVCATS